jgi:hypothetical protein
VQGRARVLVAAISLLGGALVAACGTSIAKPSPSPKASPPRSPTSASMCGASEVSGQMWTNLPAMSQIMEGITLTNTASTPCRLPGFPTSLALEDASGSVLPPIALPNPSDTATSDTDFFDSGSASAPVTDMLASFSSLPPSGVTLAPGSKAVIVMFGSIDPSGPRPGCLAAGARDRLAVYFSGGQPTVASVPSSTNVSGTGTDNPAGSALFSCSAFVLSPVMTWSRATRLVGPISNVVTAFPQLYAAAP